MKSTRRRPKVKKTASEKIASGKRKGSLIIVGGREDKKDEQLILKEIVRRVGKGKLIIATLASEVADEQWYDYRKIFLNLGIKKLAHLNIKTPDEARLLDAEELFKDSTALYFTGGDQLKITTKIGGSAIADKIFELFNRGGTIAGTSAGASVMGMTMLMGGENAESHKVGNWMMAPGLGLLDNMIIDQHFAQRGRIGRLLGAVALNPGILGIGIDEDTAIIVEQEQFRVIGSNAVYVVDGHSLSYSNISEASAEKTMSMHGVRLHILSDQDTFEIRTRLPHRQPNK